MPAVTKYPSSFPKAAFILLTMMFYYLFLLSQVPTIKATRLWTPIHWNEEFTVTASLFTNSQLNATECFRYWFSQPQIMNVNRQPNWRVATVKMTAYTPNGRVGVCGKCLRVRTMGDGQYSVIVKIVGDCPTCMPDQIEVTSSAFYDLGLSRIRETERPLGVKVLQAVYAFVECPVEPVLGELWPYIPENQIEK
ncbi:hypothetical protein EC991_000784 [Linnemannia zychae]|nr:hypothetical protein EC991_000784 [Linnemannia zychae]